MLMGPCLIRPLTEDDIPGLCAVVAAFTVSSGHVPGRYRPAAVRERLERSLDPGGPVTLVAELGGQAVALGQYGAARWAASSWELMFGATRPDLQGKGLGHALVQARLAAVAGNGDGLVFVSSRCPDRWQRYGFHVGPVNPLTGASALWRYVGGGR